MNESSQPCFPFTLHFALVQKPSVRLGQQLYEPKAKQMIQGFTLGVLSNSGITFSMPLDLADPSMWHLHPSTNTSVGGWSVWLQLKTCLDSLEVPHHNSIGCDSC